jgi:hypothetical protein
VRPVAQLPLNNQALYDVDRRRHVFEPLPMRLERDVAADGVEFALEIVEAIRRVQSAPTPWRSLSGIFRWRPVCGRAVAGIGPVVAHREVARCPTLAF